MSKSIPEYVNSLRKRSVTVYVLRSLDFLVPGEWENITDFEEMVIKVTGERDPALIEVQRLPSSRTLDAEEPNLLVESQHLEDLSQVDTRQIAFESHG